MIWHLIAAIFAGLGAAGLGQLLRLASGKRLPRWLVPVFAGLGMLGYQVYTEYSWFDHKRGQLPPSAEVVDEERSQIFWRPWTYLVPLTSAFRVVDHDSVRGAEIDGQRVVEFMLYRFERQPMDSVTPQALLLNCATRELIPRDDGPQWEQLRRLREDAPLLGAVCAAP
ncbi:hypothetical protein [Halomonas sp. H5]|uniref:hypothetical protein n=1 Tax=Halomonas sp. H5 TaxID=3423910 RepID=UPI003D35EF84